MKYEQTPFTHPNPYGPRTDISKRPVESPKPKVTTLADLFPYMDQFALGFQETFELLTNHATTKPATYPPCDILKDGDNYEIQIALAGFKKSDIKVEVQDLTLTVSSDVVKEDDATVKVVHNGIAKRNFTHTFALAQYVVVKSAEMADGILSIKLETEIPDEKKPKVIAID